MSGGLQTSFALDRHEEYPMANAPQSFASERNLTKGQMEFVDQRTRQLMIQWCDWALQGLLIKSCYNDTLHCKVTGPNRMLYIEYAIFKKWLSADGSKVMSGGWGTAARFLKR